MIEIAWVFFLCLSLVRQRDEKHDLFDERYKISLLDMFANRESHIFKIVYFHFFVREEF